MPVTITPSSPGGIFGPGLQIHLHSDTTQSIPSSAVWQIQISEDVDVGPGRTLHAIQWRAAAADTFLTWYGGSALATEQAYGQSVSAGTTVKVSAQLYTAPITGDIIDQGQQAVTFDPTAGLADVVVNHQGQGQGLTSEQAQQVQETWQSTAQVIAVDSTIPTGAGVAPPGGVVSANLPVPCFGLIVRITQLPPDLELGTPDQNYSVASLAVASFFRGTDLWMRVPVHTSSKLIPLFGDVITAAVATAIAATWLLNMSYQVAFRAGVAGEVIEMRFP